MTILITGATGFLGSRVLAKLAKMDKVLALCRNEGRPLDNVTWVQGDILQSKGTEEGLGLEAKLPPISAVYHLAGNVNLGPDRDHQVWQTNVLGTENVLRWAEGHRVEHFFLCSTAYTKGRNPYEQSKAYCEQLLEQSSIPRKTIFKPSILMGSGRQHFSQFITVAIRLHKRADTIRRHIEGTLRLPVIEPVFRLEGNPEGHLNFIDVDDVAGAMAAIKDSGTFWLTNPAPPTAREVMDWAGEFVLLKIYVMPEFKRTPIEVVFHRAMSAFIPYLRGDDFPSWFETQERGASAMVHITREYIHEELKRSLEKA